MHRSVLTVALALLLAACGQRQDARAPFTDTRLPPGLGQAGWPPAGWTWGLIQIGNGPPQRYGVAPAAATARGQLLILPGYGGLAEDEFAAASDFSARGYVVWVLEGQGQGGSGRFVTPRDLGYARSFEGDVGAIRQMAASVIHPSSAAPLVVVAYGTAAPEALRAAQEGLTGVSAVILADARFSPPGRPVDPKKALWMVRLGLGRLHAPGERPWRRVGGVPEAIRHDWQTANPDLRMGGRSYAWIVAFDELIGRVRNGDWSAVAMPVLMLKTGAGDAESAPMRQRIPRCRLQSVRDLHTAEVVAMDAWAPSASLSNPGPGR